MRSSTIIETVEIVLICFGIVYVVISAYKKGYNDRLARAEKAERHIIALKGVITKLKKQSI